LAKNCLFFEKYFGRKNNFGLIFGPKILITFLLIFRFILKIFNYLVFLYLAYRPVFVMTISVPILANSSHSGLLSSTAAGSSGSPLSFSSALATGGCLANVLKKLCGNGVPKKFRCAAAGGSCSCLANKFGCNRLIGGIKCPPLFRDLFGVYILGVFLTEFFTKKNIFLSVWQPQVVLLEMLCVLPRCQDLEPEI